MKDMGPAGRMWQLYRMGGITPALTSVFDAKSAQQMAFIRSIMKEQRKNSLYDIRLESMDAIVFDLETTGFSPYNGDEIISFGGVQVLGGRIQEKTFYAEVNIKRPIPDNIVELTGITNVKAAQAPELINSLRGFLEFAGSRILIAHGSGHDKHFLNAALWKTSKVKLHHRVLDTMMIGKWLHPKQDRYDLDALLSLYGIPITKRHHALEDSLMTAELWKGMLHLAQEQEVHTLGDLYAQLSHQI